MEADFWHQRWQENRIGFHEGRANAMLVAHADELPLASGARVFVPLCGKTRDIGWLLSRGCRVIGAELSRLAVEQLFDELDVAPEITPAGPLQKFSAPNVDIFVGDVFDLTRDMIGPVDLVYDRAALVALPREMRLQYGHHVQAISSPAPQFLICFEYDQTLVSGPPFSVDAQEVAQIYQDLYQVTQSDGRDVKGGLKGVCPARETAWLLR